MIPQGPRGRVRSLAGGTEIEAASSASDGPMEIADMLADLPDNLAAEGAREPPAAQRRRVCGYEGGKLAWKG